MKKGTIVLVRFPFTDLTSGKGRPAIIVSAHNENKNEVIVAFISSVVTVKLHDTDVLISQDDPVFPETHLHKSSVIKLDKLMTVDKELISGEIGIIPDVLMHQ